MIDPAAVVIGASAGAIEALSAVLPSLPANYPIPIAVVVHVPPQENALVQLFRAKCSLAVQEAEDKVQLAPGTVYFAPPDYHLMIENNFHFSLSSEEPVNYSRPAIDVLFESAADAYGSALVGVILTGANHDGARGLKYLSQAGGTALVQRPDSAVAATMPEAALAAVPTAQSLSLTEIADYLQAAVRSS